MMANMEKHMTTPKNKTLNTKDRDVLYRFAVANVECPAEQKAEDAAYAKAKPFVLAAVHKMYPPKDMKVLEKYGTADKDECIRFGGYYDNESVFQFKPNDKDIPLVPRYNSCRSRQYEWSAEAKKALNEYVLARQARQKARDTKMADYKSLILGARTFNDVVAIWPAAEKLRATLIPVTTEQRALAVLSEEAIARIKADNAGAK